MECDPTRVAELLVGLPDVAVVGLIDRTGGPLEVIIESRHERPACVECGVLAWVKDRPEVRLVDLPAFGRPARLAWRKHRWACPQRACPVGSWTQQDRRIAAPRLAMTDRAGRWVTEQVGRCARSVAEIARELGCDWHTINDTVLAYGTALIDDDPIRIGAVTAVGLDEILFGGWGRGGASSGRPRSSTSPADNSSMSSPAAPRRRRRDGS